MTAAVVVRRALERDVVALAALLTDLNLAVGAGGFPEAIARLPVNASVGSEEMQRRLSAIGEGERVFIAEEGETPIGFASLRLSPYMDQDVPYAELTQIYVRPAARREGVGGALMAAVKAEASREGATSLHLVTALDNEVARAFYESAGYAAIYAGYEKYLPATGELSHA
jgi:ribosomal protein S18 acetylase RimI-like enzyme